MATHDRQDQALDYVLMKLLVPVSRGRYRPTALADVVFCYMEYVRAYLYALYLSNCLLVCSLCYFGAFDRHGGMCFSEVFLISPLVSS